MRIQDLLRLIALAAIWGGSYALMRVVAPALGGSGTAWVRMLAGGSLLCFYAAFIGSPLGFRQWWKQFLFVGALSSAIPFSLIAFGMQTLPAGYGAVLNALSPLFGALFAAFLLGEELTAKKLLGITVGFVGVAILVRLGPVEATPAVLFAAGACVLATASYGYFAVHTKRYLGNAPNMGLAAGTLLFPALPLTLLALPDLPQTLPGAGVILATSVLAFVCSGVAYLLYFRLIRDVGPTKAISVTFLIPVFGMLWGVLFLGEIVDFSTLIGTITIIAGMAMVLSPTTKQANPDEA